MSECQEDNSDNGPYETTLAINKHNSSAPKIRTAIMALMIVAATNPVQTSLNNSYIQTAYTRLILRLSRLALDIVT